MGPVHGHAATAGSATTPARVVSGAIRGLGQPANKPPTAPCQEDI